MGLPKISAVAHMAISYRDLAGLKPSLMSESLVQTRPLKSLAKKAAGGASITTDIMVGHILNGGSKYLIFEVSGPKNHSLSGVWDEGP